MKNLSETFTECRTYRRYKQDKMPEELMQQILENCRTANCARNGQTLRFYGVISDEKVKEMNKLVRFAASLPPELGMPKEGEKPVAFVVIVKTEPDNMWSDLDAGLAADRIILTAWEGGFGSCIMGAINIKKIHELLGLPEDWKVRLAVALGKPDHKSTIVDVPEDGNLSYYVDEKVDYYVPKRPFDEACHIV